MFLYNENVRKQRMVCKSFYKEKERNVEGYEKIRKRKTATGDLQYVRQGNDRGKRYLERRLFYMKTAF